MYLTPWYILHNNTGSIPSSFSRKFYNIHTLPVHLDIIVYNITIYYIIIVQLFDNIIQFQG